MLIIINCKKIRLQITKKNKIILMNSLRQMKILNVEIYWEIQETIK